jgi:hypothetical protein
MKALSLWQPWASAVSLGHKRFETRSWTTSYRGPLAIHAAKTFPREAKEFAMTERALGRCPARLPFGCIVATVDLTDIVRTEDVAWIREGIMPPEMAIERLYGDYSPGRFAWTMDNVRALEKPIWYPGRQGLFEIPDALLVARGQLGLFDVPDEVLRVNG